jgi:hypothetical protein
MLAGFTPPRAPMGSCEKAPPCLVKVPQPLLLDGQRPAGKPRRRPPGGSQLRGLARCSPAWALASAPTTGPAPGQGSTRTGRGRTARPAALSVRRSGTGGTSWPQRSAGLRHPCGNQTPTGVVAASSMICTSTWCSSPSTGVACSTRRCSTGANTSWRRYARTSGRPWPSSTGT